MDMILTKPVVDGQKYKSIEVHKLIELNYDLGTLLAEDTNEFDVHHLR